MVHALGWWMMGQEEPDIIKQLREKDKQGVLHKSLFLESSQSNGLPHQNEPQDVQDASEVDTTSEYVDDTFSETSEQLGQQVNNQKEIAGNCVPETDQKPLSKLGFLMNASEKSSAAITITDAQGMIEYVNPKFMEITGYTFEESIGKNPRILKSGDHSQSFYKNLWETILSGRIWIGDFHNKRKTGEKYWEHVTISPIVEETGFIKHFIAIREDTTDKKRLESDIRIKENAILSSINAIVLTDLTGRINYVNPSFLGMWGYDSEKRVLGKAVITLWQKGGEYVKIMDEVLQDGGWVGEIIAKRHNGKLFPVQMSASLVRDEFDKPMSIMASFVDITRQKRLERNYKKFKTISDKADYGSFIHTLDGHLLYSNDSFAKIYGYSSPEIIGQNLSMFFEKEKQDDLKHFLSDLQDTGTIIGRELVHVRKDNTQVPLLVTSTVIHDEDFRDSFAAGTIIDITEIKEAQQKLNENAEELRMMNEDLQSARDQLATLNIDLEMKVKERTAEIQKLLKQKDGFINQLGHDLKTPLTPMMVLLPLIRNRVSDEKGQEFLSVIEKNIRFMKDLVNKTVDLAKLNSEGSLFDFQTIDVSEMIEEALQTNHDLFEDNHVTIVNNIKDHFIIEGNNILLAQACNNILSNAVKFMEKDTKIITLDASQDDTMVTLSIKDTGIGMIPEQMDHIFDEFYKADESRHDIGSSGLGLTITKKIVDKHGGTITVESLGKDQGTTFYIHLKKSMNEMDHIDDTQSMVVEQI
jgi:PAS domain S-box-containing protein